MDLRETWKLIDSRETSSLNKSRMKKSKMIKKEIIFKNHEKVETDFFQWFIFIRFLMLHVLHSIFKATF